MRGRKSACRTNVSSRRNLFVWTDGVMACVFGCRFVALKVQASFGFALRTRAAFSASVGGAARKIKREGLDERDAIASSAIC